MKQFGLILAFAAAAIAAPAPGYPNQRDHDFVPKEVVQKRIDDKWAAGQKKDCVFWTGWTDPGAISTDEVKGFTSSLGNAVSWYDFFDLDEAKKWQYGLGDSNSEYVFGMTSAAYADRCGRDGENIWVLIPEDRSPADPYQGKKTANWVKYEAPLVTKYHAAEKIIRINPRNEKADQVKSDGGHIIWKKNEGQMGTETWPIPDRTVWDL